MGMDDVDADDLRDDNEDEEEDRSNKDEDEDAFENDSDSDLDVPGVRASVVITEPRSKVDVMDDEDSDFQSDDEGISIYLTTKLLIKFAI